MNNVPRTEEKILLKGAPCEAGGVALAEPIVIPLLLAARLGRWTDKEGTREGKGKGQWHVKADLSWIRLGIRITIVAATAIGLLRTSDHPRELSSPLTNSPIPSPLSLSPPTTSMTDIILILRGYVKTTHVTLTVTGGSVSRSASAALAKTETRGIIYPHARDRERDRDLAFEIGV